MIVTITTITSQARSKGITSGTEDQASNLQNESRVDLVRVSESTLLSLDS